MLVGYIPYSDDFERPGDKRRFIFYAKKRNIKFEIAEPNKKYDIIILTQNADLSVWNKYERNNTKIIYDAIDSYLALPKSNIKANLRGIAKYISRQNKYLQVNHWRSISLMCERADAVTCSTQEQYNEIIKYSSNVHIILDSHNEIKSNRKKKESVDKSPFKLVWEGLPENISSIRKIIDPINKLREKYDIELNIISDPYFNKYLGKYGHTKTVNFALKILNEINFYEWNEKNIGDIISSCDLGIIPLDLNDKFALGKPENKLLLFWRLEMPVVASATPAYKRAMEKAGNKDIAISDNDWIYLLNKMICDKEYRTQSAVNGKKYVDMYHNEKVILEKWDALFESVGVSFK